MTQCRPRICRMLHNGNVTMRTAVLLRAEQICLESALIDSCQANMVYHGTATP